MDSNPASFLRMLLGNPVTIKLTDSTCYAGRLISMDERMNILLETADEIVNGKIVVSHDQRILLRGNMILYMSSSTQIKRALEL